MKFPRTCTWLSLAVQLHTVTLEILLPDQTSTILPIVLKVSLLTKDRKCHRGKLVDSSSKPVLKKYKKISSLVEGVSFLPLKCKCIQALLHQR